MFDEKNLLNTYCGSPLYASPEIVKGVPYYGPEVKFKFIYSPYLIVFTVLNIFTAIALIIIFKLCTNINVLNSFFLFSFYFETHFYVQ